MSLLRPPFINGKTFSQARAEVSAIDLANDLQVYRRNVYRSPRTNLLDYRNMNQSVNFSVSGDHVYIASMSGPGQIQFKLGRASNSWIDVDEGMTLIRAYEELWVRDARDYQLSAGTGQSECVFYTSRGQFLDRPYKPGGLRSGFMTINTTVNTAPTSLQNLLGPSVIPVTTEIINFVVYIQNVDLANKLTIDYSFDNGAVFGATTGFDISPGVILPLELQGDMTYLKDQITGAPDYKMGMRFGTRAGTCAMQVMYNYRALSTNANMEATLNKNPLQIET